MPTETITILLVEDNSADARLVQEMLRDVEAFQFKLIHVTRLDDALTCLRAKTSISVILLDLSLPDAQELEAVTRMLQVSPDMPIVVMSGLGDDASHNAIAPLQLLQTGVQDYLIKGHTDGQRLARSLLFAIERQRRQHDREQRQLKAEREALVNRISLALNSELDLRRVLDEIVRQTSERSGRPVQCCRVVGSLPDADRIWAETEYWNDAKKAVKTQLLEQRVQERTKELVQEKTMLEAIVNSIQEGICVMRPDGQVVLTNPAYSQILCLQSDDTTEPLHEQLARLQVQDPDGSVLTAEELPINRTLRGEAIADYELMVGCPNGEQKWLSINGATVRDREGKIQLAINTTRDITERKRIEEALRESEAKFRTLYESTSSAVILLDENGIFDANSAALKMFGCTRHEELCGKHPRNFFPPMQPNGEDSRSLARKYVATAIAQGSCRFDWVCRKPNGENFPAEVTLSLINLGNRNVLQTLISDITERKATERQLMQAKEEAEAGSRAKSEFLATMSHELRTPLNAVLGFAQLMQQEVFGSLNQKQKDYITCIYSSGEHLLSLIDDLLDLSKVESGQEQLIFEPLDVRALCDRCLATVQQQANQRGLKLTLCLDPEARICIADNRRCQQMLFNLLSNAVKFTLKGEVSLIVKKLPEGIAFTVADTGIGIASDKLPVIFEPFRQLDSGLNRQFSGTGLGLALTRSLARLHSGDVMVESTLGQGSQFTLYLPDSPSAELLLHSLPHALEECEVCCSKGEKGDILLVENDQRSALVLKDYLQVIGHKVKHLTDGTDFLDSVRNFKPNLILIDVQLPGDSTGFELLAALRQQPDTKNLKVVMVMPNDARDEGRALRDRCLEAGADDCISKPIGVAQLEAVLMRYL